MAELNKKIIFQDVGSSSIVQMNIKKIVKHLLRIEKRVG